MDIKRENFQIPPETTSVKDWPEETQMQLDGLSHNHPALITTEAKKQVI